MKFTSETTNKEKIELLQRWIIVHSILYYEMDFNLVEDSVFDNNCRILLKAMNKYPKSFNESYYYKTFKTFDGNTGFDLPDRLKRFDEQHYQYLLKIAINLKGQNTKNEKKKNR